MVTTSHVNGQGLWRSWQRSFRRPLDALLDLMDNAIDANHGHGKIRISSCTAETDGNDGLLLLNSYSKKAYKEMQQVLEVFSSQKEREAIGENGVGVKQASANLANLAIVVTRKGKRFQVGVLCASLQRQEGIHIPSFTLAGNCLEEELEDLCDDATFRKCMEYLGGIPSDAGKRTPTRRNSTALCHAGRDRLLRLMKDMSDPKEWPEKDCVFGLLLDQMRLDQTIESLLNELESTLPSTYLHLHAYRCDITINKNPLKFQYWERRLAELTCFPIKVSRSVDVQKVETDQMSDPKENSNKIRIFVGFDPQRSKDDNQQSCTSLYIYSRECGRLVKHVPDARNEIGLTASGTLFCQGLTVIVDDFESSLREYLLSIATVWNQFIIFVDSCVVMLSLAVSADSNKTRHCVVGRSQRRYSSAKCVCLDSSRDLFILSSPLGRLWFKRRTQRGSEKTLFGSEGP